MLTAAVIGAGRMGSLHARAYLGLQGVRVGGVADHKLDAATQVADSVGAAPFTSVVELLDRIKPDVVSVAVSTHEHAAVAIEILERGIPTLVEKPLAPTTAEASRILSAARATRTLLAGAHVERFNPAFEATMRLVADREVGAIRSIRTRRHGTRPDHHPAIGVTLDLAVHDLDLAATLAGDRDLASVEATATADVDGIDAAMIGHITFSNSVDARIDVSWDSDRDRTVVAIGERGEARCDLVARTVAVHSGDAVRHLGACVGGPDPLTRLLGDFVRAAESGSAPRVGGAASAWAVMLAERLRGRAMSRPVP